VRDQWRVVPRYGAAPLFLGLDYAACETAWRFAGLEISPDLWLEIRTIEAGAKSELNGSANDA
jgi:hypothetical protein